MIFVTVGTMAFSRLIEKMDEIAGEIDEPIVMQIGHTKYTCKNAKCFQFMNYKDIINLFRQARVIVCHDGTGTIITAIQFNKPIIAVPRLKKYGELYYNNKGEFIDALASKGMVRAVHNLDELDSSLKIVDSAVAYVNSDDSKSLINVLSEYIKQIQTQEDY